MPRYYFHTTSDSVRDPEDGVECGDLSAARQLAALYAARSLEDLGTGLFQDDFSLEVRNQDGLLLFTITTFVTDAPAVH